MKEVENRIERIAKRITAMARFGYYGGFRFFIYSYDINEKEHIHMQKKTERLRNSCLIP